LNSHTSCIGRQKIQKEFCAVRRKIEGPALIDRLVQRLRRRKTKGVFWKAVRENEKTVQKFSCIEVLRIVSIGLTGLRVGVQRATGQCEKERKRNKYERYFFAMHYARLWFREEAAVDTE